jgi:hypothetical protein
MKKIILIALFMLVPQIAGAGVYISEIMYDLDGTDSDREWIEIHNDTDQTLDLSSYYLYESNVSHRITGDGQVLAGEFAVIVDSVEKFMEDWPNFSGKIFDSSFALNNSGEELVLQNPSKEAVDNFLYNPDLGGKGTGNSLQLYEGTLIPGEPTPGEENVKEPANENEDETVDNSNSTSDNNSNASTHSSQNQLSDYKPKTKAKTGIGRDRRVAVNTELDFEIYLSDDQNGKFFWNFGDNRKSSGKKVKHIYKYPGEYNVVLNAFFSDYKTTSRVKVIVEEPNLQIITHNSSIEIKNVGKKEVNIGEFILEIDEKKEKILKDTIISKGHSIHFDTEESSKSVTLKYPNGQIYTTNSNERAQKFCSEAQRLGLNCNIEKIEEFFDRM